MATGWVGSSSPHHSFFSYTEHITVNELETLFFQVENTIRNKNWDLIREGTSLTLRPPTKKTKRKRGGSELTEEEEVHLNDPPSTRDQITNQLEINCSELYRKIKDKRSLSASFF
jgi:hypothetical protein